MVSHAATYTKTLGDFSFHPLFNMPFYLLPRFGCPTTRRTPAAASRSTFSFVMVREIRVSLPTTVRRSFISCLFAHSPLHLTAAQYDMAVDDVLNRIYNNPRTCSIHLGVGSVTENQFRIVEYSHEEVNGGFGKKRASRPPTRRPQSRRDLFLSTGVCVRRPELPGLPS